MEMRPEEMERWGVASIFKESARLLYKHYRLFLPFFLAFYLLFLLFFLDFYLPILLAGVFETVFRSPSSTPLPDTSVVTNAVNTAQTTDPTGDQSFTMIFSWTLFFSSLTYVAGTLCTGAVSYITVSLYTSTDIDGDSPIIPKVFKFLPHAFLRIITTPFCTVLAQLLLLSLVSGIIGSILQAIAFATAGWSDPNLLSAFFSLPLIAGAIYLSILFALARVIAVLEPGNYGAGALKRSTRLARIGRAGTIVAVALIGNALSAVLMVPAQGIGTIGMPVWAKIALLLVIEGLDSVLRVYFGVVSVLMYFVYKARFDHADGSAGIAVLKWIDGRAGIPLFKWIDWANHSEDPIAEEKNSVPSVN